MSFCFHGSVRLMWVYHRLLLCVVYVNLTGVIDVDVPSFLTNKLATIWIFSHREKTAILVGIIFSRKKLRYFELFISLVTFYIIPPDICFNLKMCNKTNVPKLVRLVRFWTNLRLLCSKSK